MTRDNDLCVCVVKPHGVTDNPLGETILLVFVGGGLLLYDVTNERIHTRWIHTRSSTHPKGCTSVRIH
jgi:uncharacterized integral membrane protein